MKSVLAKAKFRGSIYNVVMTDHALLTAERRGVTQSEIKKILETGEMKPKPYQSSKLWMFKEFPDRADNMICLSLSLEDPNLVIITVLVNWRPE